MDFDFSSSSPAEGAQVADFNVLQTVTEARNEHGMRQNEYDRYRVYCTKKLHRLRQLAKITHVDEQHAPGKQKKIVGKKGKHPTPAQQAEAAAKLGGNHFTRRSITTEDIKDQTILLLLLFEAERNWAHSQELKTAAFEKDNDAKLFKQGVARARRAVQAAEHLTEALKALGTHVSARVQLEASAYLCIIRASSSFDRSRHSEAIQQSCVARKLLGLLAKHSATAKDEAFANSFIDAAEPQIRFSAYQLDLGEQNLDVIEQGVADEETCEKWAPGHDALVKALQASGDSKRLEQDKQKSFVTWRERKIELRNPELIEAVALAQSEKVALEEALKVSSQEEAPKVKKRTRTEGEKVPRLTHAQRNAKRREASGRRFKGSSSKTSMDPFDRALSAITDAEALAGQLVKDNAAALAKSHSSRYQAVNAELQTVHEYLLYSALSLRIRRNDYLAGEVQNKAEKRERRAKDATEAKIKGASRGGAPKSSKVAKRSKQAKPKSTYKPRKPRKQARKFPRRPARSGTKRLRKQQAALRITRLRALEDEKSKRRKARAVPALAKLLDSAEASLNSVASLTLVEGEPDVSSLVDAKIAWYRAELLSQLAKAFSLSQAYPQAVLLLQRAQLFIRQARSALELASNIDEENIDLPPALDEKVLDQTDVVLRDTLKQTQKDMFSTLQKRAPSEASSAASSKADAMGDTSAAATLRELAAKYVDFDPASLDIAKRVPADVLREIQSESKMGTSEAVKGAAPASNKKRSAAPAAAVEDEEADAFEEADEGDLSEEEEFKDADAEDEEPAGQADQKKGWFSGWLGRK